MAKKKMISFKIDDEVYHRLKQYAFEQHQSMSSILTRWVMDAPVQNKVDYRQMTIDSEIKRK